MRLDVVLADPRGVEVWRLGESELADTTRAVCQRIGDLEALRIRLVADLENRGTAKTLGAGSTASWLSGVTRMALGAATQIVNLGKALADRPATAAAVDTGAISVAHARVIVGFFARLPDGVPAEALPECETYLLDAARGENPTELARRAATLRHLLEPVEDSLPDAENTALNELFAATTLNGRGILKADLDAETMEMLHTALSALSKPRAAADGARDGRPAPLRRADAFTELLRRYLNSGDGPVEGYERPHLWLLIRGDDLAAAEEGETGGDTADTAGDTANPGGVDVDDVTGEAAARPEPAAPPAPAAPPEPAAPPAPAAPPEPDRGAHQALFGTDPIAPGWMPWVGPISAASARRIGCDCELTTIRIDGEGVPLNLGRNQRLVSLAQRKALIARDHGCAFSGCGRPPAWTEAHHVVHWIDGGLTDLDNLVLLCGHHHRVIHHDGWTIVMGTDGHPWFLPPAWLDPLRQPRPAQHRQHHPYTTAA